MTSNEDILRFEDISQIQIDSKEIDVETNLGPV